MKLFEGLKKGRVGAAARAGVGFVTVSIVGAIGLVLVAVVLWAAALTPFGLWAGLPVIAASIIVALLLWRQAHRELEPPSRHARSVDALAPLLGLVEPDQGRRSLDTPKGKIVRPPRVKLVDLPTWQVSSVPRLAVHKPAIPDAESLKRTFDQAYAAGQFNDAERVLAELETMPGQGDWTRRKRRLVRQQRERS